MKCEPPEDGHSLTPLRRVATRVFPTPLPVASVLQAIFSMINCKAFADGNQRLIADLDVICNSEEHTPYALAA